MFTYYRALFDIKSDKDDLVGLSLMRDVEDVLRPWVHEYFPDDEDNPDDPDDLSKATILEDPEDLSKGRKWERGGNLLRLSGNDLDEQGYFWLRWNVDDDSNYRRYLGFRLATEGTAVQADVEVKVENRESGHFDKEMQDVMDTLLSKYQCSTLGVSLSQRAEQVQMEQVESLWGRLRSPERYLPIVMVSENRSGIVPVDADALQRDLMGLAEVVCCPDEVAWKLGWHSWRLLCYDGQVRVYAPQLSADDDEGRHRAWGFENVTDLEYDSFLQSLRGECAQQIHYPNGRDALRVFSRVRNRVRERMRDNLTEENKQIYDEWAEEVDAKQDEINRLENKCQQLQAVNDDRGKELHRLNNRITFLTESFNAQQSLSSGGYNAPVPGGNEDPRSRVRSVADVVEEVIKNWRYVRVFEKVVKDCAQMPKSDAQKFYDVLKKLNDCGEDRSAGTLGMSEADWMRNRISNFTGGESEPTMNQYGEERRFRDDDGTIVEMQQHIRIGKLRVHLCWSDEKSRWLVGYFGEHLTISSTG